MEVKPMVNFVSLPPPIFNTFIRKFQDLFPEKMFPCFSIYISGLFMEFKRTNIATIDEKNVYSHYQNLQYFITESNSWNAKQINTERIQILQKNRTTKSTKNGVLVIDDTACSKKWSYKTDGVRPQYSGSENAIIRCNVVVCSSYADSIKRYPLNLEPYRPSDEFSNGENDPGFKSKIYLARKLILDALLNGINFSHIVLDSWYFAVDLVKYIANKGLFWISEADVNRQISYRGKWVRADELVKLIPSTKFNKKVTLSNTKGEERSFLVYSFITKVKDIPGNVNVCVAIGKWDANDPKGVHVFVTNDLKLNAKEIAKKYSLRWGIEWMFRDLKENVGFDHYQVRTMRGITRHWYLCFLAFTFLMWIKLNGYCQRTVDFKPKTMGGQILLYRNLNSLACQDWIAHNPFYFQKYLRTRGFHPLERPEIF
jgi:SRSO17 transposase